MKKTTVLYKLPKDSESIKRYYKEKHLPLVDKMEGISNTEITEIQVLPGSEPSEYFFMAELYFKNEAQMQECKASKEGQTIVIDLSKLASAAGKIMTGKTI